MASYDALGRPAAETLTRGGATLYQQAPSYDAAGDVIYLGTTLPAGTDNQAFCYDDEGRLNWAGATGTPTCGGQAVPAGTLTGAQYVAAYGYDPLDRLTGGPGGAYTYGSGNLHAASAIGATYTAAYDAAGDMTCRAPQATATCAGTQTGNQLTYDAAGQLAAWQNAPGGSPSTRVGDLYDGDGNHVAQEVTQNGVATETVYIGSIAGGLVERPIVLWPWLWRRFGQEGCGASTRML